MTPPIHKSYHISSLRAGGQFSLYASRNAVFCGIEQEWLGRYPGEGGRIHYLDFEDGTGAPWCLHGLHQGTSATLLPNEHVHVVRPIGVAEGVLYVAMIACYDGCTCCQLDAIAKVGGP